MNLLTEHLATWIAADTSEKSARGRSAAASLYGVKKLRELILELAVRGLLVPQDPNDEPASELLKKIAAEKAQLVKEGKIKAQMPLAAIGDDEKPFELPKGWEWVRFPDVASYKVGKTPSTKNSIYWSEAHSDIPWVSISDMEHYGKISNTIKRVTEIAKRDIFKSEPISAGSILMSFKLTVGKISILNVDAFHNEAIISIQPNASIYKNYLFQFLPNRALAGNTKKAIMGNTLNSDSLALLLIPLPPLAEQQRIVTKVDELMALCDQLEQQQNNSQTAHQHLVSQLLNALTQAANANDFQHTWQRIAIHFDVLFTTEDSINQLKQSILQLAVMGKLVPQNPNDEPASELLKKIAAEKAQLVKEGKIKAQKPLPPIGDDEKPFELPKGWEWVRLGEITEIKGGKRVSNGYQLLTYPTPYIYIRVTDMKDGSIDDTDLRYIDKDMYEKISRYIITKNDIYMTIVGATIGKCGLIPEKFDQMNLTENAARITPSSCIEKVFLYKCLDGAICQNQFLDKTKQVGVQKMALNRLADTTIPLPPLAEQQRIVTKVDQLMALCDQLKNQLNQAKHLQGKIADVLVEQALA